MIGRTLSEIGQLIDLRWYLKGGKIYDIVNTKSKMLDSLNKIRQASFIGFDTETDGTDINSKPFGSANKSHLVGICISWKTDQGIYIPVDHTEIKNIDKESLQELFYWLERVPCATHNGIFDYKVMYDIGVKLNIVHDSMLLIYNIFSKVAKNSKALKYVTRLLYGIETVEFSDVFESEKDYGKFREVSEEVCKIYACADPDYTRQIVVDNFKCLDTRQRIAYMRDVSFIPLIAVAEYHGKPIDMELLPVATEKCKRNIKNLEDMLFNYVGWKMTGNLEARYRFSTTSNPELCDIFFNKLGYTAIPSKDGKISVDKFVRKKLNKAKGDEEDEFLKTKFPNGLLNLLENEDQKEKDKLISYEENKFKLCIPSIILDALRKQQKELTSFFSKIVNEYDSTSGRYYSPISMTNTETSRLVDFLQTLDGNLKYLVKAPPTKYMYVFDFSQIEYRVMAAMAKMVELCDKLDNSHTDFHVECAAIIQGILPELITPVVRKKYKPINFAIPYGMAEYGLISSIFGIGLSEKEEKEALKEVKVMMADWKRSLYPIMNMLNVFRDMACTPRPYNHPVVDKFIKNTSYIHIPDGRVRVFDLGDESKQTLSKIRRMSGNTPIQGLARTIYLIAIMAFYKKLIKEGLTDIKVKDERSLSGYKFESKVTINAFIHDEIWGLCDKDVNPYYLYDIIADNCMKKYEGHPTYYCGIAICNDWYEGKNGPYEAPIDYVNARRSKVKLVQPRDDWPEYVAKDMTDWVNKDSIRYVESLAGETLTKDGILDYDAILPKWSDYYYKTKIKDFGVKYRKPLDESWKKDDSAVTLLSLVGILVAYKYKKLKVLWKEKDFYEEVTEVTTAETSFEGRDENLFELADINFEFDDLEEDDYLSIYERDNGFNKETIEAPVNIKQNVSVLESFLFGGNS